MVSGLDWIEIPLKAPFFYGSYDLVLDTKKRMNVPAEVRRCIESEIHGNGLFVIVGHNKRPWLYPELYYKEIATQTPPGMMPDDNLLKYAHLKFSRAERVEWDPQGRTVMPEKILTRTETNGPVTLIGAGDHLELWPRQLWLDYEKSLEDQSDAIEANAKIARNTQGFQVQQ